MELAFIIAVVTLGIALPSAFAYPGGAPIQACSGMLPYHGQSSAQRTPPPFSVTTSSNTYNGRSKITVSLNAPCGNFFKGFMLQARRAEFDQDQNEALGSFNAPSGSRIVTCGSSQAVTHTERTQKSSVSFEWTAPAQSSGHVVFMATFVEHFSVYWVKVNSTIVFDSRPAVGSNSSVYPSPLACSTTKQPLMKTTTKMVQNITSTTLLWQTTTMGTSVMPDSACGVSKGCFSDCRAGKCSFLVSWDYQFQSNDILFEIQAKISGGGNRWMAIGFSNDKEMGNDSVVECVSYQGQINVYSSYNHPYYKYNTRLNNMYLGVTKVGGSFIDGIFKCSFRREIDSPEPEFFDLFDERFLLLATGKTQQFSDDKMKHDDPPFYTETKFNAFGNENMPPPVIASSGKANTVGVLPLLLSAFMCTVGKFFL
ncbi:ferric-chelate reductase 1-like [Liolophura sinensis]|uniref:ferric-chelate reductase 1-like n=1 Tax=Liolophura sinensis TaxID=3198878 RepID=UPI0031591DE0